MNAALPVSAKVDPCVSAIVTPEDDCAVLLVTSTVTPELLVSVIGTTACVDVDEPEFDDPLVPVDSVDPAVLVGAPRDAIELDAAAVDVGGGAVATCDTTAASCPGLSTAVTMRIGSGAGAGEPAAATPPVPDPPPEPCAAPPAVPPPDACWPPC